MSQQLIVGDCATEGRERGAFGQPTGGRRKAIAAFERAADRGPRELAFESARPRASAACLETRPSARRCRARRSGSRRLRRRARGARAHAGIDDDQKHRAGRKEAIAGRKLECARQHIVRRQCRAPMSTSVGVGTHAQHHGLHRAGVVIAVPKSDSSATTGLMSWSCRKCRRYLSSTRCAAIGPSLALTLIS